MRMFRLSKLQAPLHRSSLESERNNRDAPPDFPQSLFLQHLRRKYPSKNKKQSNIGVERLYLGKQWLI